MDGLRQGSIKDDFRFFVLNKVFNFVISFKYFEFIILVIINSIKSVYIGLFFLNSEKLDVFVLKVKIKIFYFFIVESGIMYGYQMELKIRLFSFLQFGWLRKQVSELDF